MNVLQANHLSKIYGSEKGGVTYKALDEFSLNVAAGEYVGVMGPSGSGKTTLLNILATIDTPTSGMVEINGADPLRLKETDLALFRRRELGFIFQDFNLLDTLSIRENIILPLVLENARLQKIEQQLSSVAKLLNIETILDKRTFEVSGGQQQRAAAARAIIHEPSILLADEPTGNLDSKAAKDLMESLKDLNEQKQAAILMVTHDPYAASFCERVVMIKDGRFFSEVRKGANRKVFFQEILDGLSLLGGEHDDISPSRG